jgi:hypothetical protein
MQSVLDAGVKVALVASLAFSATGCANSETDFFPRDGHFEDASCRAVANDRATDAGTIAEDGDLQRQVFRLSYANCIDWHRMH